MILVLVELPCFNWAVWVLPQSVITKHHVKADPTYLCLLATFAVHRWPRLYAPLRNPTWMAD